MVDEDATTVAEADGGQAKKKKSSPLITYIIIAVVMIAAGYLVGTFMGGKQDGASPEKAKKESKKETKKTESAHGEKKESAEEAESPESGTMYMMEDIIVNPSGTGGTRFLSVSIGFEVGSDITKGLFEERDAIIKDALITILGSKTIQQLSDAKEKEITRYQIKKRVEQLLKVEDLVAVYFTDFILQ